MRHAKEESALFRVEGSLDGSVIAVGGKSDPVPVHIQSQGVVYDCYANRDVAKQLGRHLFTTKLRVYGTVRWRRDENGAWEMQRFMITSFKVLNDQPLSVVVAKLRDVQGSGWKDIADPFAELEAIRRGKDSGDDTIGVL